MESHDEDGEQMMTFGSAASSSYLETLLDCDRGLDVGKSIAEDIKWSYETGMLGLAASLLFRCWHNGTGANEDDSKTSKVLFFISGDAIVMVVCLWED